MNKEGRHRGSVSSTPQLSNLESSPRRNSTGKITPRDKVSQSQINEKVLPNYLRASTSSCHDICKYGKEHTFKARERCPTFSKALGDVATTGNHEDTIRNSRLGSGRKLSVKKGVSPGSTAGRAKITDKKVLEPLKEVKAVELAEVLDKPPIEDISSSEGRNDELQVYNIDTLQEPDFTVNVSLPYEDMTNSDDIKIIKPDSSILHFGVDDNVHETNGSFELPESIKVETAVAETIGSSKELKSVKPNGMGKSSPAQKPARKILVSGKPTVVIGNLSSANKSVVTAIQLNRQTIIHGKKVLGSDSAKTTGILTQKRAEPALPTLKPSLAAKPMSGKTIANKNDVGHLHRSLIKREGKTGSSKMLTNQSSSLKTRSSMNSSSLRGQRRAVVRTDAGGSSSRVQQRAVAETCENVEEKTLYVIEPKQNTEASSGTQSTFAAAQSLSTSQFPCNEELPEHEGSKYHCNEESDTMSDDDDIIEPPDTTDEKKIIKDGKEHFQERGSAAVKLKFRRGKVINQQSENNTPRKLRFRRGTVLGNSPDVKGKAVNRSFGKKQQSGEDSSRSGPKPPKVVLRHQDSEQKKETKGLFNHVIEETASKLVETRKSKVKALVGAFETVISLQEKKSVPTI